MNKLLEAPTSPHLAALFYCLLVGKSCTDEGTLEAEVWLLPFVAPSSMGGRLLYQVDVGQRLHSSHTTVNLTVTCLTVSGPFPPPLHIRYVKLAQYSCTTKPFEENRDFVSCISQSCVTCRGRVRENPLDCRAEFVAADLRCSTTSAVTGSERSSRFSVAY